MRGRRLTIAGTMGLVALAAAGLAALKNPTRLAASLVFSLALATIVLAGVAACCLRGRGRTFWGGFAACGGTYLLLSLGPWFEKIVGPQLATTALVDLAYARYDPSPRYIEFGTPPNSWSASIMAREFWQEIDKETTPIHERLPFVTLATYSLYRVAHSLFGLAGGLFALFLTRQPHTEPPDHP